MPVLVSYWNWSAVKLQTLNNLVDLGMKCIIIGTPSKSEHQNVEKNGLNGKTH